MRLSRSSDGLTRLRGDSIGVRVPLPYPDWPVDVLDGDLAAILEGSIDAVADALVDDRGDADPAGLCQRFQTRRDVDPIAIDVFAVDDHVTEVDANPEHDTDRWRLGLDGPLDGEGAFDRINDAGEFHQGAVPHQLDHAALVGGNRRVEESLAVAPQRPQRPGFVGAHHAGIANHVGREDSRKPAIGLVFRHAPIRIGDSSAAPAIGRQSECDCADQCRLWVKNSTPAAASADVRFTPISRHQRGGSAGPFCAIRRPSSARF